ncbi:TolB family protein, partial [Singulisphaera rosea]
RGLAPTLGVTAITTDATSASIPTALVGATLRTAMGFAAGERATAGALSTSVTKLTQGVLNAMFWTKLRTAIVAFFVIAGLTSGAGALLLQDSPPSPTDPGKATPLNRGPLPAAPQSLRESGPVPPNLKWALVAPDDRLRITELLAGSAKSHFARLKTWRGSYACLQRQYLQEGMTAQAFTLLGRSNLDVGPLMQEFDSTLTFAIDVKSSAIYRDKDTHKLRFLKPGTDEEVTIPNVAPTDHRRWIVTPRRYLTFQPKEISTSAFLPDLPAAQQKRHADDLPIAEAKRESGEVNPLEFFKYNPMNTFWSELEIMAKALKGELGANGKSVAEARLNVEQADGPEGRWYRVGMSFKDAGNPFYRTLTTWSPLAGQLPIQRDGFLQTRKQPEGKLVTRVEWRWKSISSVEIPSQYDEINYDQFAGKISREQHATLRDCVVNGPLDPHQFDERGLGLQDGDLILNRVEQVAYVMKAGEPVKLADFGQGSILETPKPRPAPAQPRSEVNRPTLPGKIYTTASLGKNSSGLPNDSVVSIDPTSGTVSKVFEGSPGRFRISPDGRNIAFVRANVLWVRSLGESAEPKRVIGLESDGGGAVPSWSSDSKQLVFSESTRDEKQNRWVSKTTRINADGSGRESLPIPSEDSVEDWSPDGKWLLTASSRNAKIGWQLYLMRPDGSEIRQITEGGNPFYARFSPDGRRVLYSDGPGESRRGAWIVDVSGKSRRRLFPTGKSNGSGCWSPDGTRIAFAIDGERPEDHGRLDVVDLDGKHQTLLTFPGRNVADKPDWR